MKLLKIITDSKIIDTFSWEHPQVKFGAKCLVQQINGVNAELEFYCTFYTKASFTGSEENDWLWEPADLCFAYTNRPVLNENNERIKINNEDMSQFVTEIVKWIKNKQ